MMETKTCCTCGLEKHLSDFARDKTKKDGHHTKCKACVREYKRSNADTISKQRKQYRQENAAAIADYMRSYRPKYRDENRERLVAKATEWAKLNPEKRKQIAAKWRTDNPEASRATVRNRRARLRSSGGKHTAADIKNIGEMQRWKCACCRIDLRFKYHVDHIVPIAGGGNNDKTNLQLLCAPCNQSKNAQHPVDFMQSRGFLC